MQFVVPYMFFHMWKCPGFRNAIKHPYRLRASSGKWPKPIWYIYKDIDTRSEGGLVACAWQRQDKAALRDRSENLRSVFSEDKADLAMIRVQPKEYNANGHGDAGRDRPAEPWPLGFVCSPMAKQL